MRIHDQRTAAGSPPSLLTKVLAYSMAAVALVLAFMFSLLAVAVVVAAGLVGWGYLWWKTRGLRRQMRNSPRPPGGHVIEGEVIRDEDAQRRRGGHRDTGP